MNFICNRSTERQDIRVRLLEQREVPCEAVQSTHGTMPSRCINHRLLKLFEFHFEIRFLINDDGLVQLFHEANAASLFEKHRRREVQLLDVRIDEHAVSKRRRLGAIVDVTN